MTNEEAIERYTSNAEYERTHGNLQGYLEFKQLAEWLKDYKRLLEQQPCEDAISREDTLKAIIENLGIRSKEYLLEAEKAVYKTVENMPSVTPQPKTGHWVKVTNGRGGHECDLCHEYAPSYQSGKEYLTNYCPNCGAKMIEQQGSEE